MKNFVGVLLLCCSLASSGQEITEKMIKNSFWFTNNLDSAFYKVDTIRLVEYRNLVPKKLMEGKLANDSEHRYEESPSDYFKHGDWVRLRFCKNHSVDFGWTHDSYQGMNYLNWGKWSYNEGDNLLAVYREDEIIWVFRLIQVEIIKVPSIFKNKTIETRKLTLIKEKVYR